MVLTVTINTIDPFIILHERYLAKVLITAAQWQNMADKLNRCIVKTNGRKGVSTLTTDNHLL